MGARKSLNGQKNKARHEESKERREEPLAAMSYQTSSKRSSHQSEARTAATVWNWSGKTLPLGALLAVLYFLRDSVRVLSLCLDPISINSGLVIFRVSLFARSQL